MKLLLLLLLPVLELPSPSPADMSLHTLRPVCDLHCPSWHRGNFLYDEQERRLHLIDFGASRDYPQVFVAEYLEVGLHLAHLQASSSLQRTQEWLER